MPFCHAGPEELEQYGIQIDDPQSPGAISTATSKSGDNWHLSNGNSQNGFRSRLASNGSEVTYVGTRQRVEVNKQHSHVSQNGDKSDTDDSDHESPVSFFLSNP